MLIPAMIAGRPTNLRMVVVVVAAVCVAAAVVVHFSFG